jgi:gliding motility-associated-like protein
MRTRFTLCSFALALLFSGRLCAQGGTEKLHKRVYDHYEQKEIDLFKASDIRELNWYMTKSFIIDKSNVICSECPEMNLDTFDVIRFDYKRTDDGRSILRLPGMRYPIILFSKNEVLQTIHSNIFDNPTPQDTTIFTCNTTFYDPGGPAGNYTVGQDTTFTYCSGTPGQCIQVNFTQWGLSDTYCTQHDVLLVYDGPDTSSAWVGDYSYTLNIPSNAPTVITSMSGCLTFHFIVDACSPGDVGWTGNITCVPCPSPIQAQPSCSNVDFESGTLNGWAGTTGSNYASTWTPGFMTNRHTVTSGVGTDTYGGFPIVAPGGNFSVRLGNDSIGAQSEQIMQRFQVTTNNANFTYRYAVVLQNPSHAFFDQPFFRIEVFNDSSNIVQCGYYYVIAGQPGFQTGTNLTQYKTWGYTAVDLVQYIGQTVTIRYTTGDCSRTGHFGYAYLDCSCNPFTLVSDSGICPGQCTTIFGPTGFASYSWTGPNNFTDTVNQNITVCDSGIYCVYTSQGGNCATNRICDTIVKYPLPQPEFNYPSEPLLFSQMPVCFTNLSTISSGSISNYYWNYGDLYTLADTGSAVNPCYSYISNHCMKDSVPLPPNPDLSTIIDTCQFWFCAQLIAVSNFGCRDTNEHCFEIYPDSVIVPNVFTPNGDSHNDFFHFPNIGYKTLHCDIYNRWGNHIYSFDGVNSYWDGKINGKEASDGTYYYVMSAERLDNSPYTTHGWVELLRHKN